MWEALLRPAEEVGRLAGDGAGLEKPAREDMGVVGCACGNPWISNRPSEIDLRP